MSKQSVIHGFFKRKQNESNSNSDMIAEINLDEHVLREREEEEKQQGGPLKSQKVEKNIGDLVINDPGQRPPIWEYPVNQRDEIRRAYLNDGPYQHILRKYPSSGPDYHPRRFCQAWFDLFPDWLEYSPTKDAAFCLLCYVSDSPGNQKPNAFIGQGFCSWEKVKQGSNCAFLKHTGIDHNAPHQKAIEYCKNLMNQTCHIEKVFGRKSVKDVEKNRLRLKTSVDAARWLAYQGCAFRGNVESSDSANRGNFLEMIKLLASYNDDVKAAIDNAPGNALYNSGMVQKEILYCLAKRVQNYVREEIGEAKFCIIVDEARDESRKLVDLFYPEDFSDTEKASLRYQLQHYKVGVVKEHTFHNISTLGELCQKLIESGKVSIYPPIYRLICLVLTLPVSTATSERAFSAMRIIKNRLRNKMNDRFLIDCMIAYIEKDIARSVTKDQLVEDFSRMKQRRVPL